MRVGAGLALTPEGGGGAQGLGDTVQDLRLWLHRRAVWRGLFYSSSHLRHAGPCLQRLHRLVLRLPGLTAVEADSRITSVGGLGGPPGGLRSMMAPDADICCVFCVLSGLSLVLSGLSLALSGLSRALSGLSRALSGLSRALSGLSRALSGLSRALSGLSRALSGLSRALSGLSRALSGLSPALSGLSRALSGLSRALSGLSRALSGLSRALSGLSRSQNLVGPRVVDSASLATSACALQ